VILVGTLSPARSEYLVFSVTTTSLYFHPLNVYPVLVGAKTPSNALSFHLILVLSTIELPPLVSNLTVKLSSIQLALTVTYSNNGELTLYGAPSFNQPANT